MSVTLHDEQHYERLADDVEAGRLIPTGPRLTGEAARRHARTILRQAVGTDDLERILAEGATKAEDRPRS